MHKLFNEKKNLLKIFHNLINSFVDCFFFFREVHTEQTVDELPGPAAAHQIDQIEVHVRDTIFIRRWYREEIVPQAAALLHTGIRACVQIVLELLLDPWDQVSPSSSPGKSLNPFPDGSSGERQPH